MTLRGRKIGPESLARIDVESRIGECGTGCGFSANLMQASIDRHAQPMFRMRVSDPDFRRGEFNHHRAGSEVPDYDAVGVSTPVHVLLIIFHLPSVFSSTT